MQRICYHTQEAIRECYKMSDMAVLTVQEEKSPSGTRATKPTHKGPSFVCSF